MVTKRAFTLVELLVVLGILGVLAALLFPVFAAAREQARRTDCLSNLHQLGSAIALYAADYDDHIPYAVDESTREEELAVVTDLDKGVVAAMPDLVNVSQPYTRSREVFRCPSEHPLDYDPDLTWHFYQNYGSSYRIAIYPVYLKYTLESFQMPAEQELMADCLPWHAGENVLNFRQNELFADQHVKDVTDEYLMSTITPDHL